MRLYQLDYIVPLSEVSQPIAIQIGSQVGVDTAGQLSMPRIKTSSNYDAADGVIARAVVAISDVDNSMSFVANYASFGLVLDGRTIAGEYGFSLDVARNFTTQKPFVQIEALARSAAHPFLIAQSKGLSGTVDGSFTAAIARVDTGIRFDGTDGATPVLLQVIVRV